MSTSQHRLDQYKGRLSASQIADGMNAACRNAQRLAADSMSLLKSKRYPSAAALAILSIEEAGKASILRAMALAKSDAELIGCWKDYRRHTAKNVAWIIPDLVRGGARTLDDLSSIFDSSFDHPQVLDQVKQIAFYTDCLGNAHWSEPDEVIDKDLATSLVTTANLLSGKRVTTAEEIELWIEHIGPVWKGPKTWMENALIRWHKAMRQRGIDVTGDMEKFIRGPTDEHTRNEVPHDRP